MNLTYIAVQIDSIMDQQDGALFEYLEQESKIKNQCYRDGDVIVLNVYYEYTIQIEDCKTESELLWWVVHLSKKKWMDLDLLRRFIQVAGNIGDINIDHHKSDMEQLKYGHFRKYI